MSSKSAPEVKPEIRTINGSFSFKGDSDKENIFSIHTAFNDWCAKIEKENGVVLVSNRADYSGYWHIDRTIK